MICEDYIRHGSDPLPYVVLSDGCSSSEHTDIGARILVNQSIRYLNTGLPINDLSGVIGSTSQIINNALGLKKESLYGTLMFLYYDNDSITVKSFGDGNIILINDQNDIEIYNLAYVSKNEEKVSLINAPFYLCYGLDKDKLTYERNFPNSFLRIQAYCNDTLISTQYCNYMYPFYMPILKGYKAAFITSDGIESFGNNFLEVIKDITDFKNTKGEFLKRRMKRVIKKHGKHYDDISIGGFFL